SSKRKPNPHFSQPRGFVLKPTVRSAEERRFPQLGQMKMGMSEAEGLGWFRHPCPATGSLALKKASATRVDPRRTRLQAQMLVCPRRRHTASRGAFQKAPLKQVGLVDVLDRVALLADRDRERGEADGPAVELLRDH